MNKSEEEKQIQEQLEELLLAMGVVFESISVEDDGLGIARFNIKSSTDAKTLIGLKGEHLQALNVLIKQMSNTREQKGGDSQAYIVDVNDYQKELIEHLRNQTKIIAERVKLFKKEMTLPPMSAYERMIVHSVATTIEGVETRSDGEGRERCVVVCPVKPH